MRELTTLETFPITGRGTAHTVHVGDEPPKLDDRVLLDGEVCRVTGVGWPIIRGITSIIVAPPTPGVYDPINQREAQYRAEARE